MINLTPDKETPTNTRCSPPIEFRLIAAIVLSFMFAAIFSLIFPQRVAIYTEGEKMTTLWAIPELANASDAVFRSCQVVIYTIFGLLNIWMWRSIVFEQD